jgi:ABC-2 type transport system ATP-binding protein
MHRTRSHRLTPARGGEIEPHKLTKASGGQWTEGEPSASATAGTGRFEHQDGAAIEVKDLVKIYAGGKTALAGVSFSVGRGEIFGFLGPNGSGKTTTVRILVTLLRETSGVARVGGFDTDRQADRVREVIGYAGQSVGVDDDLTAAENLALSGVLHGVLRGESRRRAAELLEVFSLAEVADVRARRLSGGLRRRLDLAQALVHRPAVLFLDEPTSGLDPQSRNALWGLLRHLSQEGTTVFLTTQYLEEADRACDRVAILDQGKLVKVGSPQALKQEVGGGRLVVTIADEGASALAVRLLASSPDVTRVQPGRPGDPLVVYVDDTRASVAPVLRLLETEGVDVAAVDQSLASLDDVFLRYTGERPRVEARVEGAVSSMFAAAHGRRNR